MCPGFALPSLTASSVEPAQVGLDPSEVCFQAAVFLHPVTAPSNLLCCYPAVSCTGWPRPQRGVLPACCHSLLGHYSFWPLCRYRSWPALLFPRRYPAQVGLDASEVCFQPGCSASEVRSLIGSSMKEADKKLQKMFARVRKHLGTSSLAFKAWAKIQVCGTDWGKCGTL